MQNGIFKMFDLDFEGYRKLYYRSERNKAFLKNAKKWFYLANDVNQAKKIGNIRFSMEYGMSGEDRKVYMSKGAVVLYMDSKNLEEIKRQCEKAPKGYIGFNLKKDFGRAYISVLDFEDKEVVGFMMKNKTHPMFLPFSLEGNTTYEKASNEYLSLPYMVENDEFVEFIPDKYKKMLGIETVDEAAETDKKYGFDKNQTSPNKFDDLDLEF